MLSADEHYDPRFLKLPSHLRKRIDSAFDAVAAHNVLKDAAIPTSKLGTKRSRSHSGLEHQSSKRRRVEDDEDEDEPRLTDSFDTGGGFLLPDDNNAPGGFLVEDTGPGGGFIVGEPTTAPADADDSLEGHNEPSPRPDHIRLSDIPEALQIVDLPPDDEEVLAVFANAAGGWASADSAAAVGITQENALISRKDWRAVCAVLLEGQEEDEPEAEHDAPEGRGSREEVGEEEGDDDDDDDDVQQDENYNMSDLSSPPSEDEGSDEYQERPTRRTTRSQATKSLYKTKDKGKAKAVSSTPSLPSDDNDDDDDDEEQDSKPLTGRQKRESLRAFSLFFPDSEEQNLSSMRLGIKEITHAAKVLNEKITLEQTMELLDAFSAASDRTMSLTDFEKMMVAAKMA